MSAVTTARDDAEIIFDTSPQGSESWLAIRCGAITGSRAKDARDFLAPTAADKKAGITRGAPSKAQLTYAMDLAREREGGKVPQTYVNAAMKIGTAEEPVARDLFEVVDGYLVEQAGFAYTADRKFGASVDGLLNLGGPPTEDGIWECKTMVSSATLFKAMVFGDISEYRDQCLFEMWLLGRKFVLLSLWCPDLQKLHTIRIERDEEELQALEDDLMAFERRVTEYQAALRKVLGREPLQIAAPAAEPAPWDAQPAAATPAPQPKAAATAALAEDPFAASVLAHA